MVTYEIHCYSGIILSTNNPGAVAKQYNVYITGHNGSSPQKYIYINTHEIIRMG